jgi:crotonobetainyl-CoA:carnitine CoA-transferase CaiB-like acyl-CoA transferase
LVGQGDDTRTWGPPYVEDQSAYFLSINRNKQSIAIDMNRQQGQTIIREVII